MSLRPKLVIFLALPFLSLSAAEKYFPKTAVGRTELKKIPAATLIASTSQRGYFVENNGLFRPLFRYISSNNIAMTTPVEAEISPGKMYFYIGRDAADRDLDSTDEVEVLNLPQRFVASIGARGAYSESNFREAEQALKSWIDRRPGLRASGEARGIFWDGPFKLGFLKRFEVHIPVVKTAGAGM